MSYKKAMKYTGAKHEKKVTTRMRKNTKKSGSLNCGFCTKTSEQLDQETMDIFNEFVQMSESEREDYWLELQQLLIEHEQYAQERFERGFFMTSQPKRWLIFQKYFLDRDGEVIHFYDKSKIITSMRDMPAR